MPFFAFFDPVYLIIVAPGILLGLWASFKVRSTFAKWSRVPARSGLSGAQTASKLLAGSPSATRAFGPQGLGGGGVRIETSGAGGLSDHYDPRSRALRLSASVFGGRSVASIAVAAHEAGHALQHAESYAPLSLRTAAVSVANIGSKLSWVLILAGMMLGYVTRDPAFLAWTPVLLWAGVIGFGAVVGFQLITLPVEFNASRRARTQLLALGLVTRDEDKGVKAVLDAAALTYVAAAATGLLTLFYYLMRLGLLGGNRN
jgi:hypothetical protein